MNFQIFSVFDTKVQSFGLPFFAVNKGAAIRTISDAAADPSTMLNRHPNDFALFLIGEFDSMAGSVRPVNPENVGLIAAFLPPPAVAGPLLQAMEGGRK